MASTVQKLSSTKQKQSLAEVKKAEKAKKNVRKVFRSTVINSNDYEWPILSDEDEERVRLLLTSELKCLRLPNQKVPLNEIRKVKKEDRREFRHKWLTQKYLEIGFNFSAYNTLRRDTLQGVNSISSALELGTIISIIVDKDVDPPMLTKLLVPLANSREIPIVAIRGLKEVCKTAFNTKCIALGLKKQCSDPNHTFYKVFQLVEHISRLNTNIVETESNCSEIIETPHQQKSAKEKDQPELNYFKPAKVRKV